MAGKPPYTSVKCEDSTTMGGDGCLICDEGAGPTACANYRYFCLESSYRGGGGCEKCDANDTQHCGSDRLPPNPWEEEPLPCPRRIFPRPT